MGEIKNIKIENTDVFLEDFAKNQGKITLSNTYGYNYSCYWGSMGSNLSKFICQINSEYFADKLMGAKSIYKIDVEATFKNLRKFIRDELYMPWYKETEFQKDMRGKINKFQENCDSAHYFVDHFYSFINDLDFSAIKNKYSSESIEKDFKNISEPWNLIIEKENDEYTFLYKIHSKIKEKLSEIN